MWKSYRPREGYELHLRMLEVLRMQKKLSSP